jgi:hypothetical protein
MTDARTGWPAPPAPDEKTVPPRYWGVWSRTLLETPELRDTSTLVRWMQLGQWHVDLRVPVDAGGALQGFCGITRVTPVGAQEICTWQRLVDYQPPRATVDEGYMVFETDEKVLESGIHSVYFEVWERLSGSTGQRIALSEPQRADGHPGARLFVSGNFMMRVRPSQALSPAFEISFGTFSNGQFRVQASTLSALAGTCVELSFTKLSDDVAEVLMDALLSPWEILEWAEPVGG